MDFEETTDNGIDTEIVEELLPGDDVEESDEPAESLESLTGGSESGTGNGEDGQDAGPDGKGSEGPKEPGYVQGRISKAVDKALAEAEARFTAQMKAMEDRYAPIMERMLEMDAQELVRSGKVKDLDTARELVRYRQGQGGMPPARSKTEQPRQQNGQYAPKETAESARTQAQIDMLQHQADRIKASGGPDVIAEFQNNPEIKQKIIAGEMDFYDVAEMLKKQQPARRKPPSPTRSPNGVNGQIKSAIMSMSDKQFAELERRVQGGERFRE